MRMWTRAIVLIAMTIGGCTSVPTLDQKPVATAMIVKQVKCEFRKALNELGTDSKFFDDYNALFTFSLTGFQSATVGADADFMRNFTPTLFSLPITLSATGDALRTETIQFPQALKELRTSTSLNCDGAVIDDRHAQLNGEIGIRDLLFRTLETKKRARISPTQLDYVLDFEIKKEGSIKPKFTLIPLGSMKTLAAGATLMGKRTVSHSVEITIKPNSVCKFSKVRGVCPGLVTIAGSAERPIVRKNSAPFRRSRSRAQSRRPASGSTQTRGGVTLEEQRNLEGGSIGRNIRLLNKNLRTEQFRR